MRQLRFEKVPRDDDLHEERVVEAGEEGNPLRRIVSDGEGRMFASDDEKDAYLAKTAAKKIDAEDLEEKQSKKERSDWRHLQIDLDRDLRNVLSKYKGENGLADAIFAELDVSPLPSGTQASLLVTTDNRSFCLDINSPDGKKMEFDFNPPNTGTEDTLEFKNYYRKL